MHRRHEELLDTGLGDGDADVSGFSILVVDDEDLIRSLLRDLLMKIGYAVDVASSGAEAIAACNDNHYDLILMDFRLGDMDGVGALRRIREFRPASRVIFLTGDPAIEEIHATVVKEGADGFMTKPFDLDDIQSTVKQILRSAAL